MKYARMPLSLSISAPRSNAGVGSLKYQERFPRLREVGLQLKDLQDTTTFISSVHGRRPDWRDLTSGTQ